MSYIERLEAFNQRSDYQQECSRLFQLMKTHIDDPVLDIGCGVGGMINVLKQNGVNVYGIDPDKRHVLRLTDDKAMQAAGEAIPFQNDLFSAVYYMHSFAHISDPAKSLREVARVLKPGGNLYIVTPNAQFERLVKPVKSLLGVAGKFEPDTTVIKHFMPKELKDLLAERFEASCVTFGKLGFQRILAVGVNTSVY